MIQVLFRPMACHEQLTSFIRAYQRAVISSIAAFHAKFTHTHAETRHVCCECQCRTFQLFHCRTGLDNTMLNCKQT